MNAPDVDSTKFELNLHIAGSTGLGAEAQTNRDLMVKAYQSVAAGDQGALVALLHPDVHFIEAPSLTYGCDVRGIAATVAGVGGMLNAWRQIRVDIEEFAAAGDLVIAYMRFAGTSRQSGTVYEGECAEVFRFKDGLITEWRPIYWDTHAAREACLPH